MFNTDKDVIGRVVYIPPGEGGGGSKYFYILLLIPPCIWRRVSNFSKDSNYIFYERLVYNL